MPVSLRDGATILAETALEVAPLIRSSVCDLPANVRHVAGLHFGWWDDDGTELEKPVSYKCLRPTLVVLACQAVGGTRQAAWPEAVAVELIHNASLLHDDIIDRDPLRRGRPALWAAKGVPAAILAGDALFFAAVQSLLDTSHSTATVPVLLASVQTLIEGEYRDTLQESDVRVTEEDVLSVAAAKTGELMACACALGALAGGAGRDETECLRAFGYHLGIAFQCVDDVLGIWGDQHRTGKPAGSDLSTRKVTLPVVTALTGESPQARQLRAIYQQDLPFDDADCRRARELIEDTGARDSTLGLAQHHAAMALDHLAKARAEATAEADLATLVELAVSRDH
jgi:geranylgeranyl diphosphate synthase type I